MAAITLVSFIAHAQQDTAKANASMNDATVYFGYGAELTHVIRIFSHDHQFLAEFLGHDKAVTSLSWVGESFLVSGSWDGTARVWNMDTQALVTTLEGHENTVSVAGISMQGSILTIATGSAGIAMNNAISNHTIRIWTVNPYTGDTKIISKVANDHHGPIRAICIDPHGMLASCSNDGTVKLRSIETGECITTLSFLVQEQPMLLSVTKVGHMLVASAEDGHVIVWNNNNTQIIRHATSVWNVVALPEDDVATCCQDGSLRIFTQSTDRRAADDVQNEFTNSLTAALEKQQKGPSQDEVAKLPKWELNTLQHGKSEGQVQLFQKGGKAIAAQWSMASKTWIEVGEVVGSNEHTGLIDGVKYDHVLPIEVDLSGGGVAKLQIGYNSGENPFVVAQRFIDAHMLPQSHLADIGNYIQQRVGQSAPTIGMDTGTSSTVVAPLTYEHLPMQSYKSFELTKATSFGKMANKLRESGKLSDENFELLQALMSTLSVTNRYHVTVVPKDQLEAVKLILANWPPGEAFPALDLARIATLHPDTVKDTTFWDSIVRLALDQCAKDSDGTAAIAVPMLTLRLFANCYKGGSGALGAAVTNMEAILGFTETQLRSTNKNIRLSVATVLVNTALYLHSHQNMPNVSHQIVSQVNIILESKLYDGEAMIRSLVALGTALMTGPEAKAAAKALGMVGRVEMMASPHGNKAKNIAKEIYAVMNR